MRLRPRNGFRRLLLAAVVALWVLLASPALSQQDPGRAALIEQIERLARQDAKAKARQPSTAVLAYEDNTEGLARGEIVDVYNRAYDRAAQPKGLIAKLRANGGWVAAAILLLALVFHDALKAALTAAVTRLGRSAFGRLSGSRLLRRRALRHYRRELAKAVDRVIVPFRGPNRPLSLYSVYVAQNVAGESDAPASSIRDALSDNRRLLVTGPPGAGKSMLLRHLASGAERYGHDRSQPTPVLVELHRFARSQARGVSLEGELVATLARHGFPKADRFVSGALGGGSMLLLLDGIDEVPTAERSSVVEAVRDLLERRPLCPAVITCRSAVYRGELDSITDRTLQIAPFEDDQMEAFLEAWEPMGDGKSSRQLMSSLRNHPKIHAAARNPLLLTIVAHLYTDTPAYSLPRSRADFYREAADTLLGQWQQHLGANQFDAAEKHQALRTLACSMSEPREPQDHDRRTIARDTALEAVRALMPRLGRLPEDAPRILGEILERSGLLLAVDGGTRLAFAHLTLQEYFVAEALLDQPATILRNFERDPDGWREALKLWSGLVHDSSSLIEQLRAQDSVMALECLAEARSVDQALADSLIEPAFRRVVDADADQRERAALAAVVSDVMPRGDAFLTSLCEAYRKADTQAERLSVARVLSASSRPAAAQFLVEHAATEPSVRRLVVAMGDVAVGPLADIARGSETLEAIGIIAEIGTRYAARELLSMLVLPDRRRVSQAAAWGLASLLDSPTVMEEIDERAGRPVTASRRSGRDRLPGAHATGTLDRVVSMIKDSSDRSVAVAAPVARLATAICEADPSPLDIPFKSRRPAKEVLRRVSAIGAAAEGASTYRDLLLAILSTGIDPSSPQADALFLEIARANPKHVAWSVLVEQMTPEARAVFFTTAGFEHLALSRSQRAQKRTMDLVLATFVIVAVAPILAGTAVAIRLDSRGPVLFRQRRIGRDGREFTALRFRTMISADERTHRRYVQALIESDQTEGLFKLTGDARITRVGLLLRRTALDELPQIFNVWRGDLSLVGPRPMLAYQYEMLGAIGASRTRVTPGMTGPAQMAGPLTMTQAIALDLQYAANWSIWRDLGFLFKTVGYVLRPSLRS